MNFRNPKNNDLMDIRKKHDLKLLTNHQNIKYKQLYFDGYN